MTIRDTVPFNHRISPSIANEFAAQCVERGYKKKTTIEAAIQLWLSLPRYAQSDLIAGKADGREIVQFFESLVRNKTG